MLRLFKHITLYLFLLLISFILSGCGASPWLLLGAGGITAVVIGAKGSSTTQKSPTGSISVVMYWPTRSNNPSAPYAANSVVITLDDAGDQKIKQILPRGATSITFPNIAVGQHVVAATAYDQALGQGTIVGRGACSVEVKVGQISPAQFDFEGVVTSLNIVEQKGTRVAGYGMYGLEVTTQAGSSQIYDPAKVTWNCSNGTGEVVKVTQLVLSKNRAAPPDYGILGVKTGGVMVTATFAEGISESLKHTVTLPVTVAPAGNTGNGSLIERDYDDKLYVPGQGFNSASGEVKDSPFEGTQTYIHVPNTGGVTITEAGWDDNNNYTYTHETLDTWAQVKYGGFTGRTSARWSEVEEEDTWELSYEVHAVRNFGTYMLDWQHATLKAGAIDAFRTGQDQFTSQYGDMFTPGLKKHNFVICRFRAKSVDRSFMESKGFHLNVKGKWVKSSFNTGISWEQDIKEIASRSQVWVSIRTSVPGAGIISNIIASPSDVDEAKVQFAALTAKIDDESTAVPYAYIMAPMRWVSAAVTAPGAPAVPEAFTTEATYYFNYLTMSRRLQTIQDDYNLNKGYSYLPACRMKQLSDYRAVAPDNVDARLAYHKARLDKFVNGNDPGPIDAMHRDYINIVWPNPHIDFRKFKAYADNNTNGQIFLYIEANIYDVKEPDKFKILFPLNRDVTNAPETAMELHRGRREGIYSSTSGIYRWACEYWTHNDTTPPVFTGALDPAFTDYLKPILEAQPPLYVTFTLLDNSNNIAFATINKKYYEWDIALTTIPGQSYPYWNGVYWPDPGLPQ